MKIKHCRYNAFIIQVGNKIIAIDPGRNLWWLKLNSLIPKCEWSGVSHIFATHGDPDHFDYAVQMSVQSGARIICHEELKHKFDSVEKPKVHTLLPGETMDLDEISIQGLPTKHGPLAVKMGGGLMYMHNQVLESNHGGQEVYLAGKLIQKIDEPLQVYNHGTVKLLWGLIRLEKDNIEDFARGVIGYMIRVEGKSILNLGDTLFHEGWEDLKPDVLMVPIGGSIGNTMDVPAALRAVELIKPKLVIPCHYNGSFLWQRNINPADEREFKTEVEKLGIQCHLMNYGDEIVL